MAWWNNSFQVLAGQLSKGVLNEMKRRITGSNIKREKLQLHEDTQRMRQFFEREIARHKKRKQQMKEIGQNILTITKELQNTQQKLQAAQKKEKAFLKKERQYKIIIERQMKYLHMFKNQTKN